MRYTEVKNLKWANAEHTAIDCEVNFTDLPEEYLPFTATPNDSMPHGVEIYNRCAAGEFGAIAEFTPLVFSDEVYAAWARDERNARLAASDWTQLPDVPEAVKNKWAVYRQALRDVTSQAGFPHDIVWPSEPV